MKGLVFLLLLFAAWMLAEAGEVFFAFIAFTVGVLSLVAGAERPAARGGGAVKAAEASDKPPFSYQLAAAGAGFGAVMRSIGGALKWLFFRKK